MAGQEMPDSVISDDSEFEKILNRMAQQFYEASGISLPRMTDKPLIVAGLRALFASGVVVLAQPLRELHSDFGIYHECDHEHDEGELGTQYVEDVGVVCEAGLMYVACRSCCTGDGYQTEECANNHLHGPGKPPCPTRRLLDGEGK